MQNHSIARGTQSCQLLRIDRTDKTGRIGKSFTLVEMLVVIAIIGILAALLMPGLRSALETSRSVSCLNNLKQVAITGQLYANDNDGCYPYGSRSNGVWGSAEPFIQQTLSAYSDTSTAPVIGGKIRGIFGSCAGVGNSSGAATSKELPNCPYYVDYGFIRKILPESNAQQRRASQIRAPSSTLFFADAIWCSGSPPYTSNWTVRELASPSDSFEDQVDPRHLNHANLCYFDGHAESKEYEYFAFNINDVWGLKNGW